MIAFIVLYRGHFHSGPAFVNALSHERLRRGTQRRMDTQQHAACHSQGLTQQSAGVTKDSHNTGLEDKDSHSLESQRKTHTDWSQRQGGSLSDTPQL